MTIAIVYAETTGPQQILALTLRMEAVDHVDALTKALIFAASITTIPITRITIQS